MEVLQARIEAIVREVMSSHELALTPGACREQIEALIVAHGARWNRLRNDVFGGELTAVYNSALCQGTGRGRCLTDLTELFAAGYSLGHAFCRAGGGDDGQCDGAGVLGGLWNAAICLFDDACDDQTWLYPRLLELIGRDAITHASSLQPGGHAIFRATSDDDLTLRVLCALLSEYFRLARCHHDGRASEVPRLLQDAVLVAYDGEIASVATELGSEDTSGVGELLEAKGAFPMVVICLGALLCSGETRMDRIRAARQISARIGRCTMIMDDLVDVATDIDQARWNFALLTMVEDVGREALWRRGTLRRKHEICNSLIETGTIRKVAEIMCQEYLHSSESLGYQGDERAGLVRVVRSWVNYWIVA